MYIMCTIVIFIVFLSSLCLFFWREIIAKSDLWIIVRSKELNEKLLVCTCERDCQATKFYESNDLRFNSLELGGSTSWYSHVHAWHYAIDPVGPQGQLRNYKNSPRSWIDFADATRCSLWVRRFIKRFYDYERKLRELNVQRK